MLDYDADLYGRDLRIDLVARLRGEVKFDGMEALKAQLAQDCDDARVAAWPTAGQGPAMTSDTPPATTAPLTRAQQAEVERQHALIMRGTRFGDAETRATMERELRARLAVSLQDERPLRVYFGVDPTAPDLHLGHCVPLRKLRTFQQLGHHAILLIGDFTAQIGDASDKDALRPMHAAEVIAANARTYQEQAFKLLDREQTEVVHNADWLGALTFQDVVRLASHFTVAQFIERDNFRKRLDRAANRSTCTSSCMA